MTTSSCKRYFWLLIAGFCLSLLPILLLNLLLDQQILGHPDKVVRASQWQQATHGITYAPTLSDTGPFKTLRLLDRLPQINTVVFGSSTALGITDTMFPPPMRAYNFSQTGHGLLAVIGEADWLTTHAANVRYYVIPLDWSLGFIYQPGEAAKANLSAQEIEKQAQAHAENIGMLAKVRDALTYPRITGLVEILKQIVRAHNSRAAFRQYFLQDASDDYRCSDGTPGKDFDTMHRGTCTGFRYDGSATFANSEPVTNAQPLVLAATTSSSQYAVSLMQNGGVPNPEILRDLAALARNAARKGGRLLLIMPPLLPGMEAAFLHDPRLSPALRHTKNVLRDWAEKQNIVILDAGQSEQSGCIASDFIDTHHALPSCYRKVFTMFWERRAPYNGRSIAWPPGGLYSNAL